jgi:hypothetical protein
MLDERLSLTSILSDDVPKVGTAVSVFILDARRSTTLRMSLRNLSVPRERYEGLKLSSGDNVEGRLVRALKTADDKDLTKVMNEIEGYQKDPSISQGIGLRDIAYLAASLQTKLSSDAAHLFHKAATIHGALFEKSSPKIQEEKLKFAVEQGFIDELKSLLDSYYSGKADYTKLMGQIVHITKRFDELSDEDYIEAHSNNFLLGVMDLTLAAGMSIRQRIKSLARFDNMMHCLEQQMAYLPGYKPRDARQISLLQKLEGALGHNLKTHELLKEATNYQQVEMYHEFMIFLNHSGVLNRLSTACALLDKLKVVLPESLEYDRLIGCLNTEVEVFRTEADKYVSDTLSMDDVVLDIYEIGLNFKKSQVVVNPLLNAARSAMELVTMKAPDKYSSEQALGEFWELSNTIADIYEKAIEYVPKEGLEILQAIREKKEISSSLRNKIERSSNRTDLSAMITHADKEKEEQVERVAREIADTTLNALRESVECRTQLKKKWAQGALEGKECPVTDCTYITSVLDQRFRKVNLLYPVPNEAEIQEYVNIGDECWDSGMHSLCYALGVYRIERTFQLLAKMAQAVDISDNYLSLIKEAVIISDGLSASLGADQIDKSVFDLLSDRLNNTVDERTNKLIALLPNEHQIKVRAYRQKEWDSRAKPETYQEPLPQ